MTYLRYALVALLGFTFPAAADSPRVIASLGQHLEARSTEGYIRYLGSPVFWKFQPVIGLSVAGNGSGWAGAGTAVTWRAQEAAGIFLRASTMAGVYRRGSGPYLGGPIQFRTALDLGVSQQGGMEFGLGVDHRSNAGIYKTNPGRNSVYLFASMALK
ncbi:MAG: acyloxyacyl hydrolase [Roseinatronobacter sp.]|nr:acyloxyacyl hydrolase [Roseinatronobacter sp.]